MVAPRAAASRAERLREPCPELELAFDAHARLFEPWQAVQLGRALAPIDPLFLEEPIRPEHVPAWAAVKAQLPCPLATGECLYARFEFLRLVADSHLLPRADRPGWGVEIDEAALARAGYV